MRTDQYLVALALAVSTVSATAGTVCVQNKLTGKYEPKNPATGNAADCAMMNQAAAAAIVQAVRPALPPAPAAAPVTAPAVAPAAVAPVVAAVAAAAPVAAAPSMPADPAQHARGYRLKFSDVTVRLGMKRWLKDVNMQLAYEAQKDFPVPVEGDYTGPISDVVLKLMTSLSESSYPLRSCEYDNRVVLVVHRDEKCPLEEKE